MTMHRVTTGMLITLLLTCNLPAQTQKGSELLGPRFESKAAGLAMRPPLRMKTIRGAVGKPEVVRFVDDDRKWVLKVTRVILEADKPLPLTVWKDKEGVEHPGMLEFTTDQFKTDTPGAEILRRDVTDVNDLQVGMMAARFNFGLETNLTQQAIICSDPSSKLQYYIIAMTCPAPRHGDVETDLGVRDAVACFNAALSSIEILDQSQLKEDQAERLYRTRTLFVNWTTDRLKRSLQAEQWLRVMQGGKDIGYTYVVEEVGRDIPRKGKPAANTGPEGVLIGVRSRMLPAGGGQLDSESWLFCSFDRRNEAWSTVAYVDDPKEGKNTLGEVGVTRWREKPVADKPLEGAKPKPVLIEDYRLEVTRLGRNVSTEPIVRDLPPYYLPQALGQLLPRLVSLREPKTFLFATYVGDAGQLMYRYVDVGSEREVTLAGRRVRAVPVRDHVGLEGSVTTHYVSPEGKYLGSLNEDSQVTIIPTDQATVEKLWKNANLTRPGAVEDKK
jgi:hypothetical protein